MIQFLSMIRKASYYLGVLSFIFFTSEHHAGFLSKLIPQHSYPDIQVYDVDVKHAASFHARAHKNETFASLETFFPTSLVTIVAEYIHTRREFNSLEKMLDMQAQGNSNYSASTPIIEAIDDDGTIYFKNNLYGSHNFLYSFNQAKEQIALHPIQPKHIHNRSDPVFISLNAGKIAGDIHVRFSEENYRDGEISIYHVTPEGMEGAVTISHPKGFDYTGCSAIFYNMQRTLSVRYEGGLYSWIFSDTSVQAFPKHYKFSLTGGYTVRLEAIDLSSGYALFSKCQGWLNYKEYRGSLINLQTGKRLVEWVLVPQEHSDRIIDLVHMHINSLTGVGTVIVWPSSVHTINLAVTPPSITSKYVQRADEDMWRYSLPAIASETNTLYLFALSEIYHVNYSDVSRLYYDKVANFPYSFSRIENIQRQAISKRVERAHFENGDARHDISLHYKPPTYQKPSIYNFLISSRAEYATFLIVENTTRKSHIAVVPLKQDEYIPRAISIMPVEQITDVARQIVSSSPEQLLPGEKEWKKNEERVIHFNEHRSWGCKKKLTKKIFKSPPLWKYPYTYLALGGVCMAAGGAYQSSDISLLRDSFWYSLWNIDIPAACFSLIGYSMLKFNILPAVLSKITSAICFTAVELTVGQKLQSRLGAKLYWGLVLTSSVYRHKEKTLTQAMGPTAVFAGGILLTQYAYKKIKAYQKSHSPFATSR